MSKPNPEPTPPCPIEKAWRDVAYVLGYTFGVENISNESRVVRVKYDEADDKKQHMFYILSSLIGSDFIDGSKVTTQTQDWELWTPDKSGTAEITLTISKDQDVEILLQKLLATFGTRRTNKDGVVELHPTNDIFYEDLERMTGVRWKRVIGGEYGQPVLMPKLHYTPDKNQRAEQEIAIAEAAIPIRPTLKARNWLEEQTAIEETKGVKPQTAMPADLLDSDRTEVANKLSRNSFSKRVSSEVQDTFRKR